MQELRRGVRRGSFLKVLVPNLLSILRLFLLPLGLYYVKKDATILAILIFGLIVLSDIGDGMFARKWGSTSRLGTVLDHVVDKIIFVSVTYSLTLLRDFPLWAFYFLMTRELLTVLIGGILLVKGKKMAPHIIGRIAGITFSITLLSYFLRIPGRFPLLIISLLLLTLASLTYFKIYILSLFKPTPVVTSKKK
jgi:cardiolipin synthase